jgi:hypothetical protein
MIVGLFFSKVLKILVRETTGGSWKEESTYVLVRASGNEE